MRPRRPRRRTPHGRRPPTATSSSSALTPSTTTGSRARRRSSTEASRSRWRTRVPDGQERTSRSAATTTSLRQHARPVPRRLRYLLGRGCRRDRRARRRAHRRGAPALAGLTAPRSRTGTTPCTRASVSWPTAGQRLRGPRGRPDGWETSPRLTYGWVPYILARGAFLTAAAMDSSRRPRSAMTATTTTARLPPRVQPRAACTTRGDTVCDAATHVPATTCSVTATSRSLHDIDQCPSDPMNDDDGDASAAVRTMSVRREFRSGRRRRRRPGDVLRQRHDGDGVPTHRPLSLRRESDQADADGDGAGNACDADLVVTASSTSLTHACRRRSYGGERHRMLRGPALSLRQCWKNHGAY